MAVYHRKASSTQTPEIAARQVISREIWGDVPYSGGRYAAVQAYLGELPRGERGIEFETDVTPDPWSPPGYAYWRPEHPDVPAREHLYMRNGWAIREVDVVRNFQA